MDASRLISLRRSATRLLAGAGLALPAAGALAQGGASLPAYAAQQQVGGVIRTWGHGRLGSDFIGGLVQSWQRGFRELHPGVDFVTTLRGNDTAIGGLYTGAADIALMERGPSAIELDAYQPIFKHDPFEISVATGSLDVAHHAPALVVFVHRANPLARLTLAQLDAVFGAEHLRGLASVRTWGELGLRGAWAHLPITAYVANIVQDESQYFEQRVMGGSHRWSGNVREFSDARQADGKLVEAGQRILNALARDRYGIAVASLQYKNPEVKPLALALDPAGPYVDANRQTVAQRSYPLTRTVSAFVNRAPGQAMEPKLKEYLRYILSAQGQDAIARDGGYLALSPQLAEQERRKLE
jgi:phosphate transport system substrate-binding protein